MAKITRTPQKQFGSAAGTNEMAEFGSFAAGTPTRYSGTTITPAIIQTLSNFLGGWKSAVESDNAFCLEDMNAICYLFAYQLGYILQNGVAEWDSATTYYIGSMVSDGTNTVYVSLANSNTNNALTDTSKWAASGAARVVRITQANSPYTVPTTVDTVEINCASGAITVNLPALASNSGRKLNFVRVDANGGTYAATLDGNSSETIAGQTTVTLDDQWSQLALYASSDNWLPR